MTEQIRTRPTRTLAEYIWRLKNVHSFYPTVAINVGGAAESIPLFQTFSEALHIVVERDSSRIPSVSKALEGTEHSIYNLQVGAEPAGRPPVNAGSPRRSKSSPSNTPTTAAAAQSPGTLDAVMQRLFDRTEFLLKIDGKEEELPALKGGKQTLERCEVVIAKAPLFRFWREDQGDFYDIVEFMNAQGFAVHDILDGDFRQYDRALGAINLAFVKQAGRFRKTNRW
jgi:hypothetical protein